jgi:hypothetical protein
LRERRRLAAFDTTTEVAMRARLVAGTLAGAVALWVAPAHAAPRLMCAREIDQVCAVVFGTVCTTLHKPCPA